MCMWPRVQQREYSWVLIYGITLLPFWNYWNGCQFLSRQFEAWVITFKDINGFGLGYFGDIVSLPASFCHAVLGKGANHAPTPPHRLIYLLSSIDFNRPTLTLT